MRTLESTLRYWLASVMVVVLLAAGAAQAQQVAEPEDVPITAESEAAHQATADDHQLAGCLLSPLGSFRVRESVLAPSMDEHDDGAGDSDPTPPFQPWEGFVTGLRDGFESFPRPVGSPLYFEDPFINTDLRPLLLYHEFPNSSFMGGGDLTVQVVQARLALTERLQFTATANGYADLEPESPMLSAGDGYNDVALGFKYAIHVDKEDMGIVSTGVRWRLSNGSGDVFQGTEDEVSLYVTGAKQWDRIHVLADLVGRLTTHGPNGNDSVSWDVNASYELCENFFPLLEYHGFVYTSNGKRVVARDGLLDYGNLGATDVRNSMAHWGTVGFRWNFKPGCSWGAGFGFALQDASRNDIFDRRFTTNLIFTY